MSDADAERERFVRERVARGDKIFVAVQCDTCGVSLAICEVHDAATDLIAHLRRLSDAEQFAVAGFYTKHEQLQHNVFPVMIALTPTPLVQGEG